jgi:DNA-binding HxlR family transcriptional regulator
MTIGSYQQFCPVAMAAEILCTRWTIIVLREMFAGSTRFNELRRGVPRMSPALLSQRLKELEAAGIIARAKSTSDPGILEYQSTESGRELGPLVDAFGIWGQRRIESKLSLAHLDVDLLMWDMRRNLNHHADAGAPQRGGVRLSRVARGAAALLADRRSRYRR